MSVLFRSRYTQATRLSIQRYIYVLPLSVAVAPEPCLSLLSRGSSYVRNLHRCLLREVLDVRSTPERFSYQAFLLLPVLPHQLSRIVARCWQQYNTSLHRRQPKQDATQHHNACRVTRQ